MVTIAAGGLAGCARDGAPPPTLAPSARPEAVPSLDACVKAVCPPDGDTRLARTRPEGHAARMERDLNQVIEPLISEQIEQASASRAFRDLIEAFNETSFEGVALKDDVQALLNLFFAIDAANYLESRGVVEQNLTTGRHEFDHRLALILLRTTRTFAGADESLTKAAESIVNDPGYRLLDLRDHVPLSWFYAQGDTRRVSYRRFIDDTFAQAKHAEKVAVRAFPYLERPKSDLRRRYEARQVISDQDSPALLAEWAKNTLMADALTNFSLRAELLAIPRDFLTEARRAVESIRERNVADQAWSAGEVRDLCLTRYREKIATFPTTDEIHRFDRAERIPTQAVAVAALREIGLDHGADRLLTAAVHYPPPYDLALNQLSHELRGDIDFRGAQILRLTRLRDRVRRGEADARAELVALLVGRGIDDPQEINAVYGACASVQPTQPRDATFDTEIVVSWQILLRHLSGRTLAHEMGHAAYFAYAEDQRPQILKDQMACLERRHLGLEANPATYVMEDFADLVGNEVTRRMGDRRPSSLCEYLGVEDATLAQPAGRRDPHSSIFFRLLTLTGRVPRSCEAAVRQSGAVNLDEKCWSPISSAPASTP